MFVLGGIAVFRLAGRDLFFGSLFALGLVGYDVLFGSLFALGLVGCDVLFGILVGRDVLFGVFFGGVFLSDLRVGAVVGLLVAAAVANCTIVYSEPAPTDVLMAGVIAATFVLGTGHYGQHAQLNFAAWGGLVALGLLGAFVSGFHPIVKARAYAALPGRPAIVNAVTSLFIPVDIAIPLLLALIAGELGSSTAMLTFVAAPLTLGLA
ncbi:MAG: hypothetical protein HC871_06740, partial [Rhizobiales bacterium]|nr:hypothetical protein [Hyphomicrobiales bacterium]